MKKSLPGFYQPSYEDLSVAWKSKTTLFAFDTSTLLNLYGFAAQTRTDFFSILNKISENIWLPYHVALEYQHKRLDVIKREKAIFKEIEKYLAKIENVFSSDFSQLSLNRRFPALDDNTKKLQSDVEKSISNYKKSVNHWDKQQPCVRSHDKIREKLNSFFDSRVGQSPETQDWLDELYRDGEKRYIAKIPPGFADLKKEDQTETIFSYGGLQYVKKYGDLIIWKQLIEKAKNDNIESIILVTDDAKDDWWYTLDSRGKKEIGPRAALREEIQKESTIKLFMMYNTSDFLSNGKSLLEVDINQDSINDAENHFIRYHNNYIDEWQQKMSFEERENQILLMRNEKNVQRLKQELLRNLEDEDELALPYTTLFEVDEMQRNFTDYTVKDTKRLLSMSKKYINSGDINTIRAGVEICKKLEKSVRNFGKKCTNIQAIEYGINDIYSAVTRLIHQGESFLAKIDS